jgi:hypothetical protein
MSSPPLPPKLLLLLPGNFSVPWTWGAERRDVIVEEILWAVLIPCVPFLRSGDVNDEAVVQNEASVVAGDAMDARANESCRSSLKATPL